MITLFNRTRHPDAAIKEVVAFAARAIGVKGDVAVKVTRSQCTKPNAVAFRGFPYRGFMKGTSDRKGRNGDLVGERPGYVILSLPPREGRTTGWLDICEWFMECALHEMAHIRQFRENRYWRLREAERRQSPGRRMAHDRRPCEIDAEDRAYEVMQDKKKDRRRQDLVIAMAVALEEASHGR